MNEQHDLSRYVQVDISTPRVTRVWQAIVPRIERGRSQSRRWLAPALLAGALAAAGVERLHRAPYFNEFTVRVPEARAVHRRLLDRGFLAGLVLADAEPDDPAVADALLVCATEVTTSDDIARFAAALQEELAGGSGMRSELAGAAR